jgi:hypothetical protein
VSAKLAILFVWTSSTALVVKLLTAWDALPARVAVHFGLDMQPNGWSSKNALAAMVLVAVLGQAALTTFLLGLGNPPGLIAMMLTVVNVVLVSAFWQVIRYNVNGTPLRALWMFLSVVAVLASIAAVFLGKMMLNYNRR